MIKTLTIGSNCLLMAYVHVAHDCVISDNVIIANAVQLAGHINIYDYAFIGTSAVHQFVELAYMISGGSLVRKDVPPYTKAGRSLYPISALISGLRRGVHGNKRDTGKLPHYILKKYNIQSVEYIEAEFNPTVERDEIINFVQNSQRGIMKGLEVVNS